MDFLIDAYYKIYGKRPEKRFFSPSRINIIGEHLDYNQGLVLPAAISKHIEAVVGTRSDRKISLISFNKTDKVEVDLDNISKEDDYRWANYPLGIFVTLMKNGYKIPFGLNIIYSSKIPIGSGLSSSAALLNLTAFIASNVYGFDLSNKDIALLAHQSETEYNGVRCGIMDQFAIALGKKDKCILLDCATNQFSYQDINFKDLCLVVIVSNVRRNLAFSPYNKRVDECNEALAMLQKHYDIKSLSELKVSDLDNVEKILNNQTLFKRVRHVVSENQRVRDFVKASQDGVINRMCDLLNESHMSLKNDYEVTGEHLDYIHDIALKYGALAERMTGAGFGGSSIALVKKENVEEFKNKVFLDYGAHFKIKSLIFEAHICDGLVVEDLQKRW